MRDFWRHYRHDLRSLWRVFPLSCVALFLAFYAIAGNQPGAGFATYALAALVVAVPFYLLGALPVPLIRAMMFGGIFAMPLIGLANWSVARFASGEASALPIYVLAIAVPVFAGLLIRVPVTLKGRRIVHPANALVFAADDLRAEIFARIRPTAGQAFPDPLFLPNERLDEPGEVYRAPVREDAGKTMGGQRVAVVEVRPPEHLRLRVEMRIKGKRHVIDQDWHLADRPDGAVAVTVRQRMRLGPLTWLMMMAVDTVGDWLEAVLTWFTGEEMRAGYGRMVNRRVARARARADDRQARGQAVSGDA